jgi:hypothetical protein
MQKSYASFFHEHKRNKKVAKKPFFKFEYDFELLLWQLKSDNMVERFYCIGHLSTEQLRELFRIFHSRGWFEGEYHELKPPGVKPPELPVAEILLNIEAGNEHNYCVFMLDHEDEEDGVMIGLGMAYHPDFSVYLHLPPELLDVIVEKYALPAKPEKKSYSSWTELLADEGMKTSMN